MLENIWSVAILAGVACLMLLILRAILGNVGFVLWAVGCAALLWWQGFQYLTGSDALGLQMLGYALAGLTVWCVLKGAQVAVRKIRADA